jgi:hypothetical protein
LNGEAAGEGLATAFAPGAPGEQGRDGGEEGDEPTGKDDDAVSGTKVEVAERFPALDFLISEFFDGVACAESSGLDSAGEEVRADEVNSTVFDADSKAVEFEDGATPVTDGPTEGGAAAEEEGEKGEEIEEAAEHWGFSFGVR